VLVKDNQLFVSLSALMLLYGDRRDKNINLKNIVSTLIA